MHLCAATSHTYFTPCERFQSKFYIESKLNRDLREDLMKLFADHVAEKRIDTLMRECDIFDPVWKFQPSSEHVCVCVAQLFWSKLTPCPSKCSRRPWPVWSKASTASDQVSDAATRACWWILFIPATKNNMKQTYYFWSPQKQSALHVLKISGSLFQSGLSWLQLSSRTLSPKSTLRLWSRCCLTTLLTTRSYRWSSPWTASHGQFAIFQKLCTFPPGHRLLALNATLHSAWF